MTYIYGLYCPIKKQIRYIGKSIRPKGRYRDHLNDHSKTHKVHWIQNLISKNLKPELIILEQMEDDADWQAREKHWIKQARENGWPLVNGTDGGDGVTNLSGPGKERMLKTWKGRKHKPETLIKLSNASKGRLHSEKWKENMSKAMKGREILWTDKISKANKKFDSEKQKEVLLLIGSGMRVKDIADKYGVHRTTVSKIKTGKYPN